METPRRPSDRQRKNLRTLNACGGSPVEDGGGSLSKSRRSEIDADREDILIFPRARSCGRRLLAHEPVSRSCSPARSIAI